MDDLEEIRKYVGIYWDQGILPMYVARGVPEYWLVPERQKYIDHALLPANLPAT